MHPPVKTIIINDQIPLELILVEGGQFLMGDDKSEYDDEKPAHNVKVDSFYMSKYQLTQDIWTAIKGENPSNFKGERHPVENVSWLDVQDFITQLNNETKETFRLPSEAEWEYAARGGRYSEGYTYAGSDKLSQVGWFDENSKDQTHAVGQLLANELGLFDMSGNVWEWCEDWFDKTFYEKCNQQGLVENPVNRKKGVYRVLRGGSWANLPVSCRSVDRIRFTPGYRDNSFGCRLVLSLQSVG